MSIISTNGMYNIYAWQDNNRVFTVTTGEDNIKYLYLHLQDREGDIDLRDTTVQYAITKSNGSVSIEDAEIVVAGTGNIKVPITSALTNVAGFAQGEIRVITSDGVLKFYGVHLNVIQGASDENIENSQEFSILISALQKLTSVTTSGNVAALDTSITKDGVNPVASGLLYNYLYNNYVSQNRKIGGLNLTSDIAAEELGEELLDFFSIHKNEAPPVCSTATYFIGQRWIDTMRNDIYVLRTIVKNHYGEGIHNYQWEKIAKQSELSNYVQKTCTIAGLSLNNNITIESLKTALGVSGKTISSADLPPTNDLKTVAEVGDLWLISKDKKLYICYGKSTYDTGYADYLWLNLTDGYIPVKGIDYFTEEDKQEIIQSVIDTLQIPVFGRIDEENNIVITGELTQGTYTFKYEDSNGNTTTIGTYTAGETSEDLNYLVALGDIKYGNDNILYLDTVSSDALLYGFVYSYGSNTGIFTDNTLSSVSDTIKPIKVPDGKTKLSLVFPNLASDAPPIRVNIIGAIYNEDDANYIKNRLSGWSEYGIQEQTIPVDSEYIFVQFMFQGYISPDLYDLTDVKVIWE